MVVKEWVHRTSDAEVFLTQFAPIEKDALSATVVIPRTHSQVKKARGQLSSMVVFEVFRQGAFLISHTNLQIPLGWHFVTKSSSLVWVLPPPIGSDNHALVYNLFVRVAVETKRGEPYRLFWALELFHEKNLIATGSLDGYALNTNRYRALRRTAINALSDASGALISASRTETGETGSVVDWNEDDPFFFNRPGDHIVSMALIDTVFRSATRNVRDFDITFEQFAERNPPIFLKQHQGDKAESFIFFQDGATIATARTTS